MQAVVQSTGDNRQQRNDDLLNMIIAKNAGSFIKKTEVSKDVF